MNFYKSYKKNNLHLSYWTQCLKYVILINVIILCYGCTSVEPKYDVSNIEMKQLLLDKWRIVGPFVHEPKADLLYNELKIFKKREHSITYDEFKTLYVDTLDRINNKIIKINEHLFDFIELYQFNKEKPISGNVYCGCIIKSDKPKKIMLNFSANDGCIIWLNNHEIFKENKHNIIKNYDNYIELDLKKGENFLLVKIRNYIDSNWEFFACLEKWTPDREERHNVNFMIEYGSGFLNRSIIDNKLKLCSGFPDEIEGSLKLKGDNLEVWGNLKKKQKDIKDISKFFDGLYKAYLYTQEDTCMQDFYKGNIHEAFANIKEKLQNITSDTVMDNNIKACFYRYNHLMKQENQPQEQYSIGRWQRKVVYLYKNLKAIEKYLNGETQIPLNNIHSYISKIDNGVQYYQLFIPDKYNGDNPLPLIIEMPANIKRFPHPLESYRFADIELIEVFSRLSNKYNIAILCFNGRTIDRMNINNIDEVDLIENIEAIKKIFSIDSTKMYLRGACRSAFHALKLGVKMPDMWAGISLTSPAIYQNSSQTKWEQKNNVLDMLSNIRNIPILNIHSAIDKHISISSSKYLLKHTRKEKFSNYRLIELPLEFENYYSSEYMDKTIRFFLKHSKKNQGSNKLSLSTYQLKNNKSGWLTIESMEKHGEKTTADALSMNNIIDIKTSNVENFTIKLKKLEYDTSKKVVVKHNGDLAYNDYPSESFIEINRQRKSLSNKNSRTEGPFCHIFSEPFIIVKATVGTTKENTEVESIASKLKNKWKEEYYSSCRMKADTAISKSDIKNFNLLLLGNEHSNSLINKYQESISLEVTNHAIVVDGQHIEGENLNYYFIFPNPENRNKYIGIIGGNNPGSFKLASENNIYEECKAISNFGWYDYRVWDNSLMTETKGYFNKEWAINSN